MKAFSIPSVLAWPMTGGELFVEVSRPLLVVQQGHRVLIFV